MLPKRGKGHLLCAGKGSAIDAVHCPCIMNDDKAVHTERK